MTTTTEPVNLIKDEAPSRPPLTLVKPGAEPAPEPRARLWVRTGRRAKELATHDRTRTVGRMAVRHGSYVYGGTCIAARRAWDGRTAARYERMIRSCEAAGQYDEIKEWEERGKQYRAARHQRRMDLLTGLQRLPKSAASGAAVGAGGLLLLGIALAVANQNAADVLAPTRAVIELTRWTIVIASVVWGPALVAAPFVILCALWRTGLQRRTAPQWALPAAQRDEGAPITPSVVVTALRDLGISELRKAIKEMGDVGAAMLSPIVIAGCGVEVDVSLPMGVSTEEIQGRRRKLAENLGRHEHELFITLPPAARTVRLWIADSGALDEPIGPSPLVTDPDITADYKAGRAPWGQDLRGDAALISLYQRMVLVTGLSNQGKTASLRALALWLAFDVKVEFRIADLKGVGDWAMFEGLATILIQGPTDGHVLAATVMVEDGFAEMQRRLMAPKGTVFDPLVIIVDEAQVAYGCGAIGEDKRPLGGAKATSRYFQAVKGIHDQGRAVNVTIWEGTQDPTDQNLPKRSREGNHIRGALVLGTQSQAKMALGDAPVDRGAAPHKLRQGLDKGTLVVAGEGVPLPPGEVSLTIRTHYIDGDDAEVVAERAKVRRRGATVTRLAAVEERDPLTDVAVTVVDAPRVRTQEVLHRLAEIAPAVYREWTFQDLTELLEAHSAAPYKSDGVMVVSRDRVREALQERERAAEMAASD